MIREVVYVESDLDTDLDGQKDLLQVTIFRPKETDFGLKVPSLYTANPYFGGTNDDKNDLHNVDENLTKVTMENQPYFREATINTFEKKLSLMHPLHNMLKKQQQDNVFIV